ncbi:unnamed protein product [Amoebophrya sp. A25]|nr:unnamed protein product [Amoebophrya sp. A25]|eukprot:GSA25T00007707001.1
MTSTSHAEHLQYAQHGLSGNRTSPSASRPSDGGRKSVHVLSAEPLTSPSGDNLGGALPSSSSRASSRPPLPRPRAVAPPEGAGRIVVGTSPASSSTSSTRRPPLPLPADVFVAPGTATQKAISEQQPWRLTDHEYVDGNLRGTEPCERNTRQPSAEYIDRVSSCRRSRSSASQRRYSQKAPPGALPPPPVEDESHNDSVSASSSHQPSYSDVRCDRDDLVSPLSRSAIERQLAFGLQDSSLSLTGPMAFPEAAHLQSPQLLNPHQGTSEQPGARRTDHDRSSLERPALGPGPSAAEPAVDGVTAASSGHLLCPSNEDDGGPEQRQMKALYQPRPPPPRRSRQEGAGNAGLADQKGLASAGSESEGKSETEACATVRAIACSTSQMSQSASGHTVDSDNSSTQKAGSKKHGNASSVAGMHDCEFVSPASVRPMRNDLAGDENSTTTELGLGADGADSTSSTTYYQSSDACPTPALALSSSSSETETGIATVDTLPSGTRLVDGGQIPCSAKYLASPNPAASVSLPAVMGQPGPRPRRLSRSSNVDSINIVTSSPCPSSSVDVAGAAVDKIAMLSASNFYVSVASPGYSEDTQSFASTPSVSVSAACGGNVLDALNPTSSPTTKGYQNLVGKNTHTGAGGIVVPVQVGSLKSNGHLPHTTKVQTLNCESSVFKEDASGAPHRGSATPGATTPGHQARAVMGEANAHGSSGRKNRPPTPSRVDVGLPQHIAAALAQPLSRRSSPSGSPPPGSLPNHPQMLSTSLPRRPSTSPPHSAAFSSCGPPPIIELHPGAGAGEPSTYPPPSPNAGGSAAVRIATSSRCERNAAEESPTATTSSGARSTTPSSQCGGHMVTVPDGFKIALVPVTATVSTGGNYTGVASASSEVSRADSPASPSPSGAYSAETAGTVASTSSPEDSSSVVGKSGPTKGKWSTKGPPSPATAKRGDANAQKGKGKSPSPVPGGKGKKSAPAPPGKGKPAPPAKGGKPAPPGDKGGKKGGKSKSGGKTSGKGSTGTKKRPGFLPLGKQLFWTDTSTEATGRKTIWESRISAEIRAQLMEDEETSSDETTENGDGSAIKVGKTKEGQHTAEQTKAEDGASTETGAAGDTAKAEQQARVGSLVIEGEDEPNRGGDTSGSAPTEEDRAETLKRTSSSTKPLGRITTSGSADKGDNVSASNGDNGQIVPRAVFGRSASSGVVCEKISIGGLQRAATMQESATSESISGDENDKRRALDKRLAAREKAPLRSVGSFASELQKKYGFRVRSSSTKSTSGARDGSSGTAGSGQPGDENGQNGDAIGKGGKRAGKKQDDAPQPFLSRDRHLALSVCLARLPPKDRVVADLLKCRPLHRLRDVGAVRELKSRHYAQKFQESMRDFASLSSTDDSTPKSEQSTTVQNTVLSNGALSQTRSCSTICEDMSATETDLLNRTQRKEARKKSASAGALESMLPSDVIVKECAITRTPAVADHLQNELSELDDDEATPNDDEARGSRTVAALDDKAKNEHASAVHTTRSALALLPPAASHRSGSLSRERLRVGFFVRYDMDELENYKKLFPTDEEQKKIQKIPAEKLHLLHPMEQFMISLASKVKRPRERIRLMQFQLDSSLCSGTNYPAQAAALEKRCARLMQIGPVSSSKTKNAKLLEPLRAAIFSTPAASIATSAASSLSAASVPVSVSGVANGTQGTSITAFLAMEPAAFDAVAHADSNPGVMKLVREFCTEVAGFGSLGAVPPGLTGYARCSQIPEDLRAEMNATGTPTTASSRSKKGKPYQDSLMRELLAVEAAVYQCLHSESLQSVLTTVLLLGNYVNYGVDLTAAVSGRRSRSRGSGRCVSREGSGSLSRSNGTQEDENTDEGKPVEEVQEERRKERSSTALEDKDTSNTTESFSSEQEEDDALDAVLYTKAFSIGSLRKLKEMKIQGDRGEVDLLTVLVQRLPLDTSDKLKAELSHVLAVAQSVDFADLREKIKVAGDAVSFAAREMRYQQPAASAQTSPTPANTAAMPSPLAEQKTGSGTVKETVVPGSSPVGPAASPPPGRSPSSVPFYAHYTVSNCYECVTRGEMRRALLTNQWNYTELLGKYLTRYFAEDKEPCEMFLKTLAGFLREFDAVAVRCRKMSEKRPKTTTKFQSSRRATVDNSAAGQARREAAAKQNGQVLGKPPKARPTR